MSGVKTQYYLDGSRIVREARNGTVIDYYYDDLGNVVGFKYNNNYYYYGRNLQGDVVELYCNGSLVGQYEYDAWGQILVVKNGSGATISGSDDPAMVNPFRYRGYYYDSETGLYYLNSRYYDPAVKRFINADDTGVVTVTAAIYNKNLYTYCNNNTVIAKDTEGTFPFLAITGAVGAIIGAIAGGIVAASKGEDILAGAAIGAAIGGVVGVGAGAAAGIVLAGSATASTGMVVAGGSTLINTVSAGGVTAGASYMAGNISNAFGNGTQAVAQTGVYYQVTSYEGAQQIARTGKLIPTSSEGSVCVLDFQPTLAQAKLLGAKAYETVVCFTTNCTTFVQDTTVPFKGAYRNMIEGAVRVFNVIEVGFK